VQKPHIGVTAEESRRLAHRRARPATRSTSRPGNSRFRLATSSAPAAPTIASGALRPPRAAAPRPWVRVRRAGAGERGGRSPAL